MAAISSKYRNDGRRSGPPSALWSITSITCTVCLRAESAAVKSLSSQYDFASSMRSAGFSYTVSSTAVSEVSSLDSESASALASDAVFAIDALSFGRVTICVGEIGTKTCPRGGTARRNKGKQCHCKQTAAKNEGRDFTYDRKRHSPSFNTGILKYNSLRGAGGFCRISGRNVRKEGKVLEGDVLVR